jgi:hypothetical protein
MQEHPWHPDERRDLVSTPCRSAPATALPICTAQEMRCIWADMAHVKSIISPDDRFSTP